MNLSKKQIDRYIRHIIMPEIGEKGQKKLIESSVLLYGENVKELMPMVLYLSALGIGKIFCCLTDNEGYESLFYKAKDLNDDVSIEIVDDNILFANADIRVMLGSVNFIKNSINNSTFIPTIISMTNDWQGTLQTFTTEKAISEFIGYIGSEEQIVEKNTLITSFIGALCTVECVKLLLNLGKVHEDLLLFDMLNMEFSTYDKNKYEIAINNFNNQCNAILSKDEILKKLKNSKVLIVGSGGLGSPAALSLAIAGVGTIGLLDLDKVELSNLNRQILHSVSRLGVDKPESAKSFILSINNDIKVNTHIMELNIENSKEIISNYDVVISAVDNIQTRYIINDTCYLMKKPIVEAGVLRFDGTNTTIIPDEGHCYRCLYPNVNISGMTCSQIGILGSVAGVMGFIEAIETVKIINRIGSTLKNKILLFDGLEMEFNIINLEKNPECPICS